MLDLIGVQKAWDEGDTEQAGEYTVFCLWENRK
jgi:hypothetical protein